MSKYRKATHRYLGVHGLPTRRRERQREGPGHSERNIRQAGFYSVPCAKHGTKRHPPNEQALWLYVPPPRHKRDQNGCPKCAKPVR